jgi:ATP-dependent DNA helicase DinG
MEKVRTHLTDNAEDENRRLQTQGPLTHLANDLIRLNKVGKDELIWLTRNDKEITIELSLVDVGPRLRDELWGSTTGILTSATIPANLVTDLGLTDISDSIEVASPFDYANHALLYVPDNFPERTDPNAEAAIIEELVRLITASGGRCLSLFTNRSVMKRVAEAVEPRISTPVLVQDTLSRARLIERFRDEETSSLFAVTSYWQGIDVPGDSLRLVTIDRLPFQPPNDPLGIARRDRAGSSAFSKVDIPRAGMLLAQGVGRLIRSTTDKGVVAVLDTRLATASYRHPLIRRLPPMARTRDFDEVETFLQSL